MADKKRDYDIGYSKPPAEHRFVTGQSGNPKGRPKGSRGMKTVLREKLRKKQAIKVNGKEQIGSRLENMFETLTLRAGAGDLKAQAKLIELCLLLFGPENEGEGPKKLSSNDQRILDEMLQSLELLPPAPEQPELEEIEPAEDNEEEIDDGDDDIED